VTSSSVFLPAGSRPVGLGSIAPAALWPSPPDLLRRRPPARTGRAGSVPGSSSGRMIHPPPAPCTSPASLLPPPLEPLEPLEPPHSAPPPSPHSDVLADPPPPPPTPLAAPQTSTTSPPLQQPTPLSPKPGPGCEASPHRTPLAGHPRQRSRPPSLSRATAVAAVPQGARRGAPVGGLWARSTPSETVLLPKNHAAAPSHECLTAPSAEASASAPSQPPAAPRLGR